jgi:very-short-patch-repair endonuclease
MNKNIERFLKRKSTKEILGDQYILTSQHVIRLTKVFDYYGSPKKIENWLPAIAYMVKYNLTNYASRIKRLKHLPASPSVYSLMLRYGVNWKEHHDSHALKRTLHFKNKIDYWTNLGFTTDTAIQKVSETQTMRSAKSPASQRGATEYSIRCVGYWLKKGFSEEEAKREGSSIQSKPRSPEVIEKWLESLLLKTDEEKELINRKKGHSIDAYMLNGYDTKTAEELSILYYAKRTNYSQTSQSFFILLESLLGSNQVYYKVKNYEKQFGSRCVDFYDADTKTVIEYYGDFWHRNPTKYHAEFIAYNKKSRTIWEEDAIRIETIARHHDVNRVIIIWESEVINNPHNAANSIITEIKDANKRSNGRRT